MKIEAAFDSQLDTWLTEPLMAELQPYIDLDGPMGPMLKHPLVYELMPYSMPGRCNARFKYQQKAVAEALKTRRWLSYIMLHEQPYRPAAMEALLRMRRLTWKTAAPLLPDIWIDSENIPQCLEFWRRAFNRTNGKAWMDSDDRAAYDALPESIEVWRGECNDGGYSWTLDEKIAAFFAKRNFNESTGIVSHGIVLKRNVFAYLTRRDEAEVIVTDRRYVEEEVQ